MAKEIDEDSIVCRCTRRRCGICTLISGVLLFVGGVIGLIVAPIMTEIQVKQMLPPNENSFTATQWINPPVAITMQFWMFNTTNPDEILRGIAKPAVSQKGPYAYKQQIQKNQVMYGNSDNVSYVETSYFFFDKSKSCSSCFESDYFTVPNAIFTSVAHATRFFNDTEKRALNLVLMALGEKPFMTKPLSQLLFDGVNDKMLTLANAMSRFVPEISQFRLPKVLQYFPKNGTSSERIEVCIGNNDVKSIGKMLSWNGKKKLDWWNSEEANKIQGTDGQLFPPHINRDDKLPIFVGDMCRSVYLKYASDVYFDGLQSYKFTLAPEVLDMTLPENKGFCQPTDKYFLNQPENCLPSGLMNLSTCQGAPIILSLPHFRYASKDVVESVDGIKPTTDHELEWLLQPTFGAPISVQAKFQLNVPIHPDNIFMSLKQVKPAIIPLFWFNASAVVDRGTRDFLFNNIVILQSAGYVIPFAILLVGAIMTLTVIACHCRYRLKSRDRNVIAERTHGGHDNRALIEETDPQNDGRWSQKI